MASGAEENPERENDYSEQKREFAGEVRHDPQLAQAESQMLQPRQGWWFGNHDASRRMFANETMLAQFPEVPSEMQRAQKTELSGHVL